MAVPSYTSGKPAGRFRCTSSSLPWVAARSHYCDHSASDSCAPSLRLLGNFTILSTCLRILSLREPDLFLVSVSIEHRRLSY